MPLRKGPPFRNTTMEIVGLVWATNGREETIGGLEMKM